jgi:hypothetical protein
MDLTIGVHVPTTALSADEAWGVESLLIQIGVSVAGAREFAFGQAVASPFDRQRIAQFVLKTLAS